MNSVLVELRNFAHVWDTEQLLNNQKLSEFIRITTRLRKVVSETNDCLSIVSTIQSGHNEIYRFLES